MAILVEAQGEMLNQIEYNVSQSVAYTAKGVEELKGAVKLQKKSRKVIYFNNILCYIHIFALSSISLLTVFLENVYLNLYNGDYYCCYCNPYSDYPVEKKTCTY